MYVIRTVPRPVISLRSDEGFGTGFGLSAVGVWRGPQGRECEHAQVGVPSVAGHVPEGFQANQTLNVPAHRGPLVRPHPEDDAKRVTTCGKARVVFVLDDDPGRESTRFKLFLSGRRREKAPQRMSSFSNLVTIWFAPFAKVAWSVLLS